MLTPGMLFHLMPPPKPAALFSLMLFLHDTHMTLAKIQIIIYIAYTSMEYDSRLTLCTTLLTRTSITRVTAQRVLYCVEMGDRDNNRIQPFVWYSKI